MDGSGTHRVEGDPGNHPDSTASVVGGQVLQQKMNRNK